MLKDSVKRICLWSGPRNISTTLMYSFAQRKDTCAYDEPLYAHYIKHSKNGINHPGAEQVLQAMENDGNKVIEWMMGPHHTPVVFFKNITHHLLDLDKDFMRFVSNIILTRDPYEMIPSFAAIVANPDMLDVGYEMQWKLVNDLQDMNIQPIVLDAKKVLLNPGKQLMKLCDRLNISFDPDMLHWQPGPKPEDGVWAKYWYKNVHQSVGFKKYKPKTTPFPEELIPLYESCKPYYDQLMQLALD